MSEPDITHQPAADGLRGTFDLNIDGQRLGFLSYSLDDDTTMYVDYVQVDPSLRGKQVGRRLVHAAVEWARASHRHVVPICSYARSVLKDTPAYGDVFTP